MHEMSITKTILGIVRREMKKNGVRRLRGLKIRVGELTAVEPDALRFCFDACIKDTAMEGAYLHIEESPLTGVCGGCKKNFTLKGFRAACPSCGGTSIERLGGMELDVVSMEAV